MKKILIIIIIIFVIVIILLGGYYNKEKLLLDEKTQKCKLIYVDDNIIIDSTLSTEETSTLFNIFNNKKLFKENLSCGFDDTMLFNFGGSEILIASDGDPFFYVKEKDKYIKVSTEEMEWIKTLIKKYGGEIPNV